MIVSVRGLRRLLAAVLLALVSSASFAASSDSAPDGDASCPPGIDITSIESTPEGLAVKAVGPIAPHISSSQLYGDFSGTNFSVVVLDIPNGHLAGPATTIEWKTGAFVSARIVRYRTAVECGLRVRLSPRQAANWIVQPRPDGALLTSPALLAPPTRSAAPNAAATESESGAATVSGTAASSRYNDGSEFSSVFQAGVAQTLRRLGTLKAFAASISPGDRTGSPYGAIGLFGVPLDRAKLDVAGGDLYVTYGEAGLAQGTYINNLLIRGAGAAVLLPKGFRLQAFSGRAAVPSLFRLRTGTVLSEISDDRVHGVQGSWVNRDRSFGLGIGYAYSDPVEAPRQHNWIQTIAYRSRETYALRASAEESLVGEHSGFALTVEPQVETMRSHATGFYRFFSANFAPPLGSSYYANLRHSYGFSGSHRFSDRTQADASFSQTKNFNPFDPEDVGTLSDSGSVGLSQQISRSVFATATVSQGEYKSEPGAVLPADSKTTTEGVGLGFVREALSMTIGAGHEETENRIVPEQGLQSTYTDGDVNRTFRHDVDAYLRWRWADSVRPGGEAAGTDYSISSGVRMTGFRLVDWRGELGFSERPSGVSATAYRELHATVGVRTGAAFVNRRAGLTLTYQRLMLPQEPAREVFIALIDAGALTNWGNRQREVSAPFETRAINVSQTHFSPDRRGDVKVVAFSDVNRNGIRDADEPPLAGVNVIIDDRSYVTDKNGSATASVLEGDVRLQVITTGAATEFYVPERRKSVEAKQDTLVETTFALVPAGQLSGVLHYIDTADRPASLAGISIVAVSAADRFEATADRRGEFRFGQLPAGTYKVSIDRDTLPASLAVKGDEELTIEVKAGERREVEFSLRKATTRERLGIPGGGSSSKQRRSG